MVSRELMGFDFDEDEGFEFFERLQRAFECKDLVTLDIELEEVELLELQVIDFECRGALATLTHGCVSNIEIWGLEVHRVHLNGETTSI